MTHRRRKDCGPSARSIHLTVQRRPTALPHSGKPVYFQANHFQVAAVRMLSLSVF